MEEEHIAAAPGQVCWIVASKIYGDVNAPETRAVIFDSTQTE